MCSRSQMRKDNYEAYQLGAKMATTRWGETLARRNLENRDWIGE